MLLECFLLALLRPPCTSDGDFPTDRNLGLKWQTLKTCFLSSLATAHQRSFLLALSVAPVHSVFRRGDLDGQSTVSLLPEPGFIAKNQLPHQVPSWVKIPGMTTWSLKSRENVVPCQETLFILEWYKEHQKRSYKSLQSLEPIHSWYLPEPHFKRDSWGGQDGFNLPSDEDLLEKVTTH